jgi:5-methylthioadenosine/S-adenosylhomocysteine deaminase
MLAPGLAADVIGVDTRGAHHAPDPDADPWSALVHAARGSDVRFTMVAGRVLYRDGAWSTLDPAAVLAEARSERQGLLRRAGRAA